jgi:UDP-glucose 4-epimerase
MVIFIIIFVLVKERHWMSEKYAILGGAGFIGNHLSERLLSDGNEVLVIDNFCSGSNLHVSRFRDNPKFTIETEDIRDTKSLSKLLTGINTVVHLASNPDISKAATEPRIDFINGTVLTESVVEACRKSGVKNILYSSGSGVYGDAGTDVLTESSSLSPISTYGASKLAGEALLSSYAFMFDIKSIVFRFANVVGGMQTHGIGYDFLKKLKLDNTKLEILGDGTQSKSYIHVSDVISGILKAKSRSTSPFEVFNVSTNDSLTVKEIADLTLMISGLENKNVDYLFTGGKRGWKADIPIVRLSSEKLRSLGWVPYYNSFTAMKSSLEQMIKSKEK